MSGHTGPRSETAVLFQTGDFTLASGQKSSWKIECDALSPAEWDGLAAMLADLLPPFGRVYGVPTGGEPLMDALYPYRSGAGMGTTLVVDDVWTTGASMARYIEASHHPGRIVRAVVFARVPTPPDVLALFTMAGQFGSTPGGES